MNFYLFSKSTNTVDLTKCVWLSEIFMQHLLKNGIISGRKIPILGGIDQYDDEIILDLESFKSDIIYVCNEITSIDFSYNSSFVLQAKELPNLIKMIDYAIDHDMAIYSSGV